MATAASDLGGRILEFARPHRDRFPPQEARQVTRPRYLRPVKGGWVLTEGKRPRYLFTRRRRLSFPAWLLVGCAVGWFTAELLVWLLAK